MEIVVRKYKRSDYDSLNEILNEAFGLFKKSRKSKNIELVAVNGREVIGYLVIDKIYDSVNSNYYFLVNYVCVKEKYRNKGVASLLFEKVFEIAKYKNISYIELTSNEGRVEANHLYKKLGFNIRKTNVFRKEFL